MRADLINSGDKPIETRTTSRTCADHDLPSLHQDRSVSKGAKSTTRSHLRKPARRVGAGVQHDHSALAQHTTPHVSAKRAFSMFRRLALRASPLALRWQALYVAAIAREGGVR